MAFIFNFKQAIKEFILTVNLEYLYDGENPQSHQIFQNLNGMVAVTKLKRATALFGWGCLNRAVSHPVAFVLKMLSCCLATHFLSA